MEHSLNKDVGMKEEVPKKVEAEANTEETRKEEKTPLTDGKFKVPTIMFKKPTDDKKIVANDMKNDKGDEKTDSQNIDVKAETVKMQEETSVDDGKFKVPTIMFKKPTDIKKSDSDEIKSGKDNEKSDSSVQKKGFPLKEPSWGGKPETSDDSVPYSLTVLKDGVVKNTVNLTEKSRVTFGRSDDCDVLIEHPSCSRYHAVLQYCVVEKDIRKKGYYLYDMESTHGTYLNKSKVKPKIYNRVRVGYQMKFGGSTRVYIVEGPEEDQEKEMDLDIMREKKRQYEQHKLEQKRTQKTTNKQTSSSLEPGGSAERADGHEKSDEDEGASWGFGEDAQEEGINLKELFENKQNFEVKDPKKTLNGFFEREGLEFEYEMSEKGSGKSSIHVAIVRLPFDTEDGEEVIAEGSASNKKDAVLECATEACRLIQAYDMMVNRTREDQRKVRQRALEANDFYDSDEDSFLDRTGNLEKKRLQRKKRAGKDIKEVVDTHESLKTKLQEKQKELQVVESKLLRNRKAKDLEENGDGDSLDSYMSSMKDRLDKTTEMKFKRKKNELSKDIQQLESLVEKTKPALPALKINPNLAKVDSKVQHKQKDNSSQKIPQKPSPKTTATIVKEGKSQTENVNIQKENENDNKKDAEPPVKKAKKKVYGAPQRPKYKPEKEVVDWTPPEGQTGDGRTALNDKLGY